jgi:outer membrane biosynthesis protein TonB
MRPKGVRVAVAVFFLAPVLMLAPGRSFSQEPAPSVRKILTRVAPQYPAVAKSMSIGGTVRVVGLVAPNGTVKSVKVLGGHPLLAEAAQKSVPPMEV